MTTITQQHIVIASTMAPSGIDLCPDQEHLSTHSSDLKSPPVHCCEETSDGAERAVIKRLQQSCYLIRLQYSERWISAILSARAALTPSSEHVSVENLLSQYQAWATEDCASFLPELINLRPAMLYKIHNKLRQRFIIVENSLETLSHVSDTISAEIQALSSVYGRRRNAIGRERLISRTTTRPSIEELLDMLQRLVMILQNDVTRKRTALDNFEYNKSDTIDVLIGSWINDSTVDTTIEDLLFLTQFLRTTS